MQLDGAAIVLRATIGTPRPSAIVATPERRFAPLQASLSEDEATRARQEGAFLPRAELLDSLTGSAH